MFESMADPASLVEVIESTHRRESMLVARRMAAVAALLRHRVTTAERPERPREYAAIDGFEQTAAEVAAAMNLSPVGASYLVSHAEALDTRLPRVAALLAEGRTDWRTVRLIISRTDLVTDEKLIAKIDQSLAERIGNWHGWSKQRIINAVDAAVRTTDPDAARERRLAAEADRHIGISTKDDGMADIYGSVAATTATAFDRRLSQLAKQVCPADPRTLDQRRADALAALAEGRGLACACGQPECPNRPGDNSDRPTGAQVVINVVASDRTLHADGAEPGYVEGYGVIDADQVRQLAAAASILVADPVTSPVEALRYQPSAALERAVRCRDLTCRFPGCSRPAVVCDLDHTIPFNHQNPAAGGLTVADNLKCLCRQHHRLKTFGGWRDKQLADGTGIFGRHTPRRPLRGSDGEESPFAGHALEPVSPAVVEFEPGPDHQVAQRARHQHLVRPSQCAHPCADVHGNPTDVLAADFTLAGVQPGAHLDTQNLHRIANRHRAADRSLRPIEHREEAITRAVHLTAPKPRKLGPHDGVVRIKERMPVPVAHLRRPPGRVHDVGEKHCGQHPIIGHVGLLAGEELSDHLKGRAPGFHEVVQVAPWHLDVFRIRYMISHLFSLRRCHERILAVLDDKGRHTDCRKDWQRVHFGDERHHQRDGPRACCHAFFSRPRGPDLLVPRHVRIEHVLEFAGSPRGDQRSDGFVSNHRAVCRTCGAVEHNKRGSAGRMRCREQRGCRERARIRDKSCFAASESVEHGGDAVGPLLQGRQRAGRDGIGASRSRLVEKDQPTKRCHRFYPPLNRRQLRKKLTGGEPVRNEHNVTSTRGRCTVGDAQVPVHRVARLREHAGSLSRAAGRAMRIGSVCAAHKCLLNVL